MYNCYELFVDELTDRNLQYLTHVLGLAEEQQEIKVVEVKKPMPEEIKKLLSHREAIKLTICARDDAHICRERIERGLACLYKCIKCSDMVIWMEKKVDISYGGTAILCLMMEMALVCSIARKNYIKRMKQSYIV